MSAGHRWQDIQGYTLGQVGVFLRVAHDADVSRMATSLWESWAGNHASHDGITSLMREVEKDFSSSTTAKNSSSPRESAIDKDLQEQKEIEDNWRRLKQTLSKLK